MLCVAVTAALLLGGTAAAAETVKPLPAKDCKRVRLALENGLPFGPGFRRLEVEFPKNQGAIEGRACRLLTMGTGAHMEGYGIASLNDMRTKVRGALTAAGLAETAETARFSEKSRPGRAVFALYKDNAICVTTIVVGLVNGATPAEAAIKDGKVLLAKIKPHQREWWISVDCFNVPRTEAEIEAKAKVGDETETFGEIEETAPENAPPK